MYFSRCQSRSFVSFQLLHSGWIGGVAPQLLIPRLYQVGNSIPGPRSHHKCAAGTSMQTQPAVTWRVGFELATDGIQFLCLCQLGHDIPICGNYPKRFSATGCHATFRRRAQAARSGPASLSWSLRLVGRWARLVCRGEFFDMVTPALASGQAWSILGPGLAQSGPGRGGGSEPGPQRRVTGAQARAGSPLAPVDRLCLLGDFSLILFACHNGHGCLVAPPLFAAPVLIQRWRFASTIFVPADIFHSNVGLLPSINFEKNRLWILSFQFNFSLRERSAGSDCQYADSVGDIFAFKCMVGNGFSEEFKSLFESERVSTFLEDGSPRFWSVENLCVCNQ